MEHQGNEHDRTTLWRRFGTWVVIGVIVYIAVGAVVLAVVPGLLLQNWLPTGTVEDRAKLLGTAAQIVLIGLGGVIAVVGVGLSLSRHRQESAASGRDQMRLERDAERELRSRFVTAVTLLSDDAPVKRQAGLFALGALADDWERFERPDEVRVCIEVITAYLRAPLPEGASKTASDEVHVKQAGYNLIRSHLVSSEHSWSAENIRLDGAYIDFTINFDDAILTRSGSMTFDRATFAGEGALNWNRAKLSDTAVVSLERAVISDEAAYNMSGATVSGQACILLNLIRVNGNGHAELSSATITDEGSLLMEWSTISEQGEVSMPFTRTSEAATVSLYHSTIRDDGRVDFRNSWIGGSARFKTLTFADRGQLSLIATTAIGAGQIVLDGATIGTESTISLDEDVRISHEGPIILPDISWFTPPTTLDG